MTTMTSPDVVVTGRVDTHQDQHVAAALDQLGRVLGAESFPTAVAGYRRLLAWLRRHGQVDKVGVEGTGSYGAALARHLAGHGIEVIEVARPNRQVRRRLGKTAGPNRPAGRPAPAFRISADDDSVQAMTRLALHELAQWTLHLTEQLAVVGKRLARITAPSPPSSWPLRALAPRSPRRC